MAAPELAEKIKLEVFKWLNGTRYASTVLEPLSGGSANFLYRAHLSKPLEDGTTDVLVKHFEEFMAVAPQNKMGLYRSRAEEECLKVLATYGINPEEGDAFKYVVRAPKCYLSDEVANTQIHEYCPQGLNLKAYALKHLASPATASLRQQFHQLGKVLAQYIVGFHSKFENEVQNWLLDGKEKPEPKLYAALKANEEMQKIRRMTYYDWLVQRIDAFPTILEQARDVFVKIQEKAAEELKGAPEELLPIHGDFWPGNTILPDQPIREGVAIPVFVGDWEMAQLGAHGLDHGQMLGEMYALWLYKKIDAGLWMVQGYAEGLGEQTESSAWRNALQVGCHLVTFGTLAPGWGTPDQVEDVARLGGNIIVNAWGKNREWLENSELACLFTHVTWGK